jgi:putative MATE family efflux protein
MGPDTGQDVPMPGAERALDREILRLALPALGALIAEPLYVLADTAVVGRLGTDRLAGLALATSILLIAHSVLIFLAYGTTAAVSRLLGANDHRGAAHQAVQSLWLATGLGLALAVVGLPLSEPLLVAIGADDVTLPYALTYLRISLLGLPAMLIVLAGTGYLRGLQDTFTPLVVALASAAGNLVLELVLVFGMGFDIGASALSTVVAQTGAAAVYVSMTLRHVRQHDVGLRPHPKTLARLGVVGGDLFIRTAALRGSLIVTTAVAASFGTVALAAHHITLEVWNLCALALDAVAIAGQALVGRYLGAEDAASARRVGDRMLIWGTGAGLVVGGLVLAGHSALPRLFTDDAAVIAVAGSLLVVAGISQPLNGVVFALDGLLIGAGDMRWLAVAMSGAAAVYIPLALLIGSAEVGIDALWWGLAVLMLLRLGPLWWRWRSDRWAVLGA